jgi:CheY-like chemotaxis protein/anti-sigma regulatory factor (Ser/Thr protein kinase)
MNGVIGMNDLLLETPLSDEQRTYAEQVSRSSEHMLAIINDILDISTIETGRLELDRLDFDLRDAVDQACAPAALEARAKGIDLAIEIAAEVPRRVSGDGSRLRQVLMNLVSNAVKFTTVGLVTVRLSHAADPGEDGIRFEVTDTGIGIDPQVLERMFEPFTQADVSTTRHYGGTGLGLAIARELVEMMGGVIGAVSQPGHGSTFSFEVELSTALATVPLSVESNDAVALSWPSPPLVLIAEDSQINQIVATRALERCGCHVHIASDGLEALNALLVRRYDAVMMDCQMPNMDGYQATAELRRREQAGSRTPVIAMTAHAMDAERQRCLDAGMDDYISKPMRHADLTAVLRRRIVAGESEAAGTVLSVVANVASA